MADDDNASKAPKEATTAPKPGTSKAARTNMAKPVPQPDPEPEPEQPSLPPPVGSGLIDLQELLYAGHEITRVDWMNSDRTLALTRRGDDLWGLTLLLKGGELSDMLGARLRAEDVNATDWYVVR